MTKDSHGKCVFCDIIKGKGQAHRIYEDDLSLGILDTNPFTPGHCLVVSKRHVPRAGREKLDSGISDKAALN